MTPNDYEKTWIAIAMGAVGTVLLAVTQIEKLNALIVRAVKWAATPVTVIRELNQAINYLATQAKEHRESTSAEFAALRLELRKIGTIAAFSHHNDWLAFENDTTPRFECDPVDGKCRKVNAALAQLFGMKKEDMLGFGWSAAIVSSEQINVVNAWMEAMKLRTTYRKRYPIEAYGKTLTVEAHGTIICGLDGEPISVLGTVMPLPIHL